MTQTQQVNLIARVAENKNKNDFVERVIAEMLAIQTSGRRTERKVNTLKALYEELELKGENAIYNYIIKFVKLIFDEGYVSSSKKDMDEMLNDALDWVIETNDPVKVWYFTDFLMNRAEPYGYNIDVKKCSEAVANVNRLTENIAWAELYDENRANIDKVLNSNNCAAIIQLLLVAKNLTENDIDTACDIIVHSGEQKYIKELNSIIVEKNL